MGAPLVPLLIAAMLTQRRRPVAPPPRPTGPAPMPTDSSTDPDPLGSFAAQHGASTAQTSVDLTPPPPSTTPAPAPSMYGGPSDSSYGAPMQASYTPDASYSTQTTYGTPPAPMDQSYGTTPTSDGYSPSGADAARGLAYYYASGGRDRSTIASYQQLLGVYPDGIVGPITRAAAQRYGVTIQ